MTPAAIRASRWLRLCALAALVPAAFNIQPAAAHGAGGITVPLCTGDGVIRRVTLPVRAPRLPSDDPPGCCVKGCHGGSSRKRNLCPVDPAQ